MLAGMLEHDHLNLLPWHDVAAVHLVTEAMRRAYAARNTYLGDPAAVTVPVAKLLAPAYLARLRASIDPARATPSAKMATLIEPDQTTHLAAVDQSGLVVSLTTTINGSFGSGVVVAGAGYLLNDEMDDFAVKPGTPNTYGLVQGEANAVAPGRRMLSSMSPTIVVDARGAPVLVTGAQGGSRIITAVWQVIMNVLDFGMDVGHAVAAPRFHHQHLPDELVVEAGALDPARQAALEAMGHEVVPARGPLASTPTLVREPGGGWSGAADPRKSGLAAGD
jgi:gamma-glutamyltranspeptidase/glutathione hydrolase